jgi:hypothetical protein
MKTMVAALVLKFLGAGILVLQRKYSRMQEELTAYEPGSALQIRAWDGGPVLCLAKSATGAWTAGSLSRPLGSEVVEVVFKSPRSAILALLGLQSVSAAFLENRVTVRGDLMVTLPLVRAVNLAEAHLFPRWWTKPIGTLPPRRLTLMGTWFGALAQLISPQERSP